MCSKMFISISFVFSRPSFWSAVVKISVTDLSFWNLMLGVEGTSPNSPRRGRDSVEGAVKLELIEGFN